MTKERGSPTVATTFEYLSEYDVRLEVGETFIDIQPMDTYGECTGIQFYAAVDFYNYKDGGFVEFCLRTQRSASEQRHPFFKQHPVSKLAAQAIRHFEISLPIHGINFSWGRESAYGDRGPSVNYTTYIDERDRLQNDVPIETARVQAAFATWTAQKIALPNEFTRLETVREEMFPNDDPAHPTKVTGTFRREPSTD